jgi:hypothetical protein
MDGELASRRVRSGMRRRIVLEPELGSEIAGDGAGVDPDARPTRNAQSHVARDCLYPDFTRLDGPHLDVPGGGREPEQAEKRADRDIPGDGTSRERSADPTHREVT